MTYLNIYMTFIAVLAGAVMGSFVNCWVMRYEAGERYPRGRSRCPRCGHVLGPAELVPVLSWLFLRGRCRSCRERISVRYPVTELLGAAAFGLAFWRFGISFVTVEYMLLFSALLFLALEDLDTMELADGAMIFGAAVFVAFAWAHSEPVKRLWQGALTGLVLGGAVLGVSLLMDKVLGRESLGGGDIKLLAMAGLYLGPWEALLMVIIACCIGLVFAVVLKAKGRVFPFGPSICVSTVICSLVGEKVVEWYVGLF